MMVLQYCFGYFYVLSTTYLCLDSTIRAGSPASIVFISCSVQQTSLGQTLAMSTLRRALQKFSAARRYSVLSSANQYLSTENEVKSPIQDVEIPKVPVDELVFQNAKNWGHKTALVRESRLIIQAGIVRKYMSLL